MGPAERRCMGGENPAADIEMLPPLRGRSGVCGREALEGRRDEFAAGPPPPARGAQGSDELGKARFVVAIS